jgi:hypothetical protein
VNDDTNPPHPDPDAPASQTPPVAETVRAAGSYQMPADYYSQPPTTPSENRGCPRWVPITCGAGGCLILVLLFGLAFMVARGASSPRLSLWFVDRVEVELRGMMTAEVTPAQRAAFDAEFAKLEASVTKGEIKFLQLGEWLETTRSAMNDRKLTPAEVDDVIESLRKATAGKSKKSARGYRVSPSLT